MISQTKAFCFCFVCVFFNVARLLICIEEKKNLNFYIRILVVVSSAVLRR